MKVAIDTGPLGKGHKVRGVGVHINELIKYLRIITKGKKDIKISAVDFSKTDLSEYDVAHYQFFHPHFLSIPYKKPDAKVVLTIHDMVPLIYPKHYPSGMRGFVRFQIQKYLLKYVDAIVTISETSKKDIVRFLNIPASKIDVVHLAPGDQFRKLSENPTILRKTKKKYGLPENFVLYVGDVNYNKNIPSLLKACEHLKTSIVTVGKQARDIENNGIDLHNIEGPRDWVRFLLNKPHPELAHYRQLKDNLCEEHTHCTGYVSNEELVAIYNSAIVYCQPSFYEGFGLPVLEAMACGTPVVASKTKALKEVAGDAALYFNPKSSKDLAKSLKKVINSDSLQQDLITKGNDKVKEYSWKKTAEGTLRVYEKVLGEE